MTKKEQEYTNTPKVTEVKTEEQLQVDIFLVVKVENKYRIALTNKIVSKFIFETAEQAEEYINSKPWELILNATAVMMEKLKEIEETTKKQ